MANYYVRSGAAGAGTGADWANAFTSVSAALSGRTNADTLWVANDHAESANFTLTCPTSPGLRILGVNTNATEPPTGLVSTPTAVVGGGTANAACTVNGFAYINGIIFRSSTSGSSGATLEIGSNTNAHGLWLDNCHLEVGGVNAVAGPQIGALASSGNDDVTVTLTNCRMKFAATTQLLKLAYGRHHISGLSLDSAGSTPTTLLQGVSSCPTYTKIEASDLSGEAWTNLISAVSTAWTTVELRNCKLPSGTSLSTGTHTGPGGVKLTVHNCDSGDTQYNYGELTYAGTVVDETTIVRTGGGATSVRMDSSANVRFPYLPLTVEGAIYNDTLSARTLTVEVIHSGVGGGGSGDFTNAELWVEVQHQGTSGFPLGVVDIDDRAADVFATAADQDNSSVTWASSPATPVKQYLQCSFTPAEVGYVHFKVCLALASKTVYVDILGAALA